MPTKTPRIPGDDPEPHQQPNEPKLPGEPRRTGNVGLPTTTADQPTDDPRQSTGHSDPGLSDPADEPTYDIDEALAAGARGTAHRATNRAPNVPPSPVVGDPERPAAAAVNQEKQLSYAEAMDLLHAGKLKRSVLTEQGWVNPPNREPPKGAAI